MDSYYQAAIDGTLVAQGVGAPFPTVAIVNKTSLILYFYLVTSDGDHAGWNGTTSRFEVGYPTRVVVPDGRVDIGNNALSAGDSLLFVTANTGAFAAVVRVDTATVEITGKLLSRPNDIGTIPVPTRTMLVPPDSTRVVVGYGVLSNGNTLIREQYWRRLPESCSLAPRQTREMNYTTTTGMQSVTSTEKAVSESLGASVSAGWGPISASISANMSTNSRTFQQMTLTQETTVFTSDRLENPSDVSRTFIFWQLTDVLTISNKAGLPLSAVVTGGQPVVIGGPYTQGFGEEAPAPPAPGQRPLASGTGAA